MRGISRTTAIAAAIAFTALCATSCGLFSSSSSDLYYWGGTSDGTTVYEDLSYQRYKTQTPESLCELICGFEDMVQNPGGVRQTPPPGICAEYGYILLLPETASTFAQSATEKQKKCFERSDYEAFFAEYGLELLEREVKYYPEAAKFIEPLIKRLAR